MEIESVVVYSTDSNYAVIKPPGRSFPGAVIQGDSLAVLCDHALSVVSHVENGDTSSEDFLGEVEELTNSLIGRLLHYQAVLNAHEIRRPHRPLTDSDLVQLVPNDDG